MSAADDFMERVLAILGGGNAGSPNEWAARMLAGLDATDRLALARALVADMPGVVVAKVPAKASQWDSPGYDHWTPPNIIWADGYNAAIAAIITAGSATDA